MTATPMSDRDLDAVAERLAADIANGDHFPAWLSGTLDLDAALAVQLRLLRRHLDSGERLAGWKVGLTSDRARRTLNADVRPFGFILASHVFASDADVEASTIRHASIEPEFLFTIASRLRGPDLSPDDVRAGIERVAAGFELNERRAGTTQPDIVAMATDRMTQWGVVEGSGTDPSGLDLDDVEVHMWVDGEERLASRSGDEVDDHWTSIARLVTELDHHGLALEPGQKVITGGLARFDLAAGQRWRASFEGIGEVAIRAT
jgi:2-oxo-3-hexenedioate decarboxylase